MLCSIDMTFHVKAVRAWVVICEKSGDGMKFWLRLLVLCRMWSELGNVHSLHMQPTPNACRMSNNSLLLSHSVLLAYCLFTLGKPRFHRFLMESEILLERTDYSVRYDLKKEIPTSLRVSRLQLKQNTINPGRGYIRLVLIEKPYGGVRKWTHSLPMGINC